MNLKCPVCHANFAIEQLTQDEAARELLRMRPLMLPSMMPYLALFRTGKRDLAFDKALKLVNQVHELTQDLHRLEMALASTVDSIKAKRDQGDFRPLKDHNYLKRVLEGTPEGYVCEVTSRQASSAQPSKTAGAIGKLQRMKG